MGAAGRLPPKRREASGNPAKVETFSEGAL